jgi:hypothetical protein
MLCWCSLDAWVAMNSVPFWCRCCHGAGAVLVQVVQVVQVVLVELQPSTALRRQPLHRCQWCCYSAMSGIMQAAGCVLPQCWHEKLLLAQCWHSKLLLAALQLNDHVSTIMTVSCGPAAQFLAAPAAQHKPVPSLMHPACLLENNPLQLCVQLL